MTQRQTTKRYMAMVLMEVLEKQQPKLTVTTFIRAANLSRTTFYNHFPTGMCGLFQWTLQQKVLQQVHERIISGNWEQGCHEIIQFVTQHPNFCLNLYHIAEYDERRRFFEQITLTAVKQIFERHSGQFTATELGHLEDFYSWAIIRQIDNWFEGNLRAEAQEIDERVCFNLRQVEQLIKAN